MVLAEVDLVEDTLPHQTEVEGVVVLVVANAISGLVLISLVLLKALLSGVVVLVVRLSPQMIPLAMLGQLARPLHSLIFVPMAVAAVLLDQQVLHQVGLREHPSRFSTQALPATVGHQGIRQQDHLVQHSTAIPSLAQVAVVVVVLWQITPHQLLVGMVQVSPIQQTFQAAILQSQVALVEQLSASMVGLVLTI